MASSSEGEGIHYSKGGTALVGEDAVSFFMACSLASAIMLYVRTGGRVRASRNHTPKNMLAAASRITGKTYKRTELELAANDVREWARTMKAALPHTLEGKEIP